MRGQIVTSPRLGNRVRKANGRTPTNPGGGRVRSPLCGFPFGKFRRRHALFHSRHRIGGVAMRGKITGFLARQLWSLMAIGHVVPGLRPAQVNWWCPAKKDTTHIANCCVVGESRLKPPPSAARCCVVGELRLNPPPPQKKHTQCRVLRVLRVASDSASGVRVARSARVARSRRCLRCCLWSLNVRVPRCADTPLFENAISHESLCGCTPPGGLCGKYHAWSPARPN